MLIIIYLQEERETLDVEDDVVLHHEVGDVMESAGPVVGVVDGVPSHVAGAHVAGQVEMDWISAHSEGLSSVQELGVLDPGLHQELVLVLGTDDDDHSELV